MRGDPEANNLCQTSLPHPMFNNRLCREGGGEDHAGGVAAQAWPVGAIY